MENSSKFKQEGSIRDCGVAVKLRDGESFESLVRRFRKRVVNCEVMEEINKRQYYEKPSVKRRRQQKTSLYLQQLRTKQQSK